MKAIKPIQEGGEIFNDYGEIPRADLLRRYGYVTDNYASFDVVEFSLAEICQAAGLPNSDVESQPRVYRSIPKLVFQIKCAYLSLSSNYSKNTTFLTTAM